jgi:DNA-binding PadR family transcriptional regulator
MGHRNRHWHDKTPDFGSGTPGAVPDPGDRRARGRGGPPPWVGELFGPGMGHGFGHGGGRGRGRGPRVRRGDVRAAILDVLAATEGQEQPLNGYQVIQQIADRTAGVWKPSPGSVYPTIQQLEDEDLVTTAEVGGRKVLRLTEAGSSYVAEHPDEMAAVWAPFSEEADDDGGDFLKTIKQTMSAVAQLATTGTPEQIAEAASVLADTRRRLYTILAEGDPE